MHILASVSVTLRETLEGMVVPDEKTKLANSLAEFKTTLHDVVKRRVVESVGSCSRESWLE